MTSTDVLFTKKLPVIIKSPDKEKRKVSIQLCLEVQSTSSPVPKKVMVIRLTDEQDLFFLYSLHLGEDDFQSLKMQQGLLVDFTAFPQSVIDLLQSIIAEEHKEYPKFILELECGAGGFGASSSTLNIVETNKFKHLTHLALKFLPGSDGDIKKYLALCLKTLKDQNLNLYNKLQHTESELTIQLKEAREALSSRTHQLDNLTSEWTAKLNELSSKHSREINDEREKALRNQAAMQNKHDREKKELETSHSRISQSLETRVFDLDCSNKDLLDNKYKAESVIREVTSKLSMNDEELKRTKTELSNLRKNNAALDGSYHEQDKLLNQFKTRIAVLEQEVKDKNEVLKRTTDLLTTEQEQKKRYEDETVNKQKEVRKLEISVKKVADDLAKGNEIIHKLQNEIKNYHAKLKIRNTVSTEQEKLLQDKGREMEELRKTLSETQNSLKQKEDEIDKLSESNTQLNQKLEESKKLLHSNEQVIDWLNKQVTGNQLNQQRTAGTFEMNSTPMSSVQPPAFRPPMNYSDNSYGTRMSSHSGSAHRMMMTASGPISAAPPRTQYQPRSQPQVRYNVAQSKKSGLPVPVAKSSPIETTIPEEGVHRSSSPHSSPLLLNNHKSNGDAFIDAKYFQSSSPLDDASPRFSKHDSATSTSVHFGSARGVLNTNRLNNDIIVAPTVSHPLPLAKTQMPRAPLSSAYFPS